MEEGRSDRVRRVPRLLMKGMGLLFMGFGVAGSWTMLKHIPLHELDFGKLYYLAVCGFFFLAGLLILFARKGFPLTWRDQFAICRQAREQPDCLDEAVPLAERLEHLDVMLEQGVISEEAYERMRAEMLQDS